MQVRILLISLIVFLISPVLAFAQENPRPTPVVLPKTQTVNQNYFGTGSTVDMEGTVNGDAYVAGGTVLINGTVNGDVLAAGGQVTIRGSVHNVRVVGGQVIIDGKVNGNVTIVGGSLTLTGGSSVTGSVVGAGGQMYLSGPVEKSVTFGGGQINIENSVGGNTTVAVNHLILTSNAKIAGALWYQSPAGAQIDNGAVISGKITHAYPPQQKSNATPGAFFAGIGIFVLFSKFILELIVGALLIALVPFYTKRVLDKIQKSPWESFGIGFLAWVLTPIVFVILLVTVIGIPFAFLTVFAVVIFSYIGKLLAALFLGNWALERTNQKRINVYGAFIVGILIVEIIGFVPFFGWLFGGIVSAVGFGAVLMMERNYYLELRTKKIL